MALNIVNKRVEAKAKEVARLTGKNKTAAVEAALDFYLTEHDCTPEETRRERRRRIDEIIARVDALPVLDDRTPDEIIGYDEHGLPS